MYKWEQQVKEGGNRFDKLKRLYDMVYERFFDAKSRYLIVCDSDLRRWALQANREVMLEGFRASKYWIHKFKRCYSIVSRKVTKFVTAKFLKDEKRSLEEAARNFVGKG